MIELLRDRNKAFEVFRKSYRKNEVIEENKQLLRDKYEDAKRLGQAVNDSRSRISIFALIELTSRHRQVSNRAVAHGEGDAGYT